MLLATRSKEVVSDSPPGRLARPVVSMVLTEPPPPEPSISRMIGMRNCAAICSDIFGLPLIEASAEPPRKVKSSPAITTGRPSTVPRPNTQLAGMKAAMSLAVGVVGRLAGDCADLVEAVGIEHAVDPLADRQPAAFVLALDALLAAHLLGERRRVRAVRRVPAPSPTGAVSCGRGEGESSGIVVLSLVWRQLMAGPLMRHVPRPKPAGGTLWQGREACNALSLCLAAHPLPSASSSF